MQKFVFSTSTCAGFSTRMPYRWAKCSRKAPLQELRWSRLSGQKKDVYFFCEDSEKERDVAR